MQRVILFMYSFIVLFMLSAMTTELPSSAEPIEQQRLIVISVPGLSFLEIDQLHSYPAWHQFIEGKVAALNVRTPERGIEDTYLSIGSGAPAIAWGRTQSWMTTEGMDGMSVEMVVKRYTGKKPLGQVVIPSWVEIDQFNKRQSYSAVPGLLGETLKRAGIDRYVFGNRDLSRAPSSDESMRYRHAPLILADKNGEVQYGNVSAEMNVANMNRSYGMQTNYDAILNELQHINRFAVIVIELGDLDRLYSEKNRFTKKQFTEAKNAVIADMDQFLGELMNNLEPADEIWLFSPLSHATAREQKSLLTPFMQFDQSNDGHLLISNTTRQLGIVSYADITASILNKFDIEVPSELRGNRLESVKKIGHVDTLLERVRNIEYVYQLRPKLIYPLVTYQVTVLLVGLVFLFWRAIIQTKFLIAHEKWWDILRPFVCTVLLSILIAPFVLLFVGPWRSVSQSLLIIIFYAVILIAGWLLLKISMIRSLILVGLVTGGAILIDGVRGAMWMKQSVLGYDPMIGARFYGIGNEYMGVLIGAVILAFSAMHQQVLNDKIRRAVIGVAALLYAGIVIFLAAPNLGTNAGGAISACVASASFFILLLQKEKKVKVKTIFTVGVVGFVTALFSLWALNHILHLNDSKASHIGKALDHLFTGRFDLIFDIIYRKLSMNLHLVGVSSWSKLLTAGVIVMIGLSIYSKSRHFQRWKKDNPSLASGMTAILFGAVTAFLVNDSGIVAAAVMIIYAAVPMLLVHLNYSSDSHSANSGSS